jgi:hypothetical protein
LPQNEAFETETTKALEDPLQRIQPIKFFTPQEMLKIIQKHLNPRMAPGYDLITGRKLKEMPRKVLPT